MGCVVRCVLVPFLQGGLVSLRLSRVGLAGYVQGLKMAVCAYNKRLKWLTSGECKHRHAQGWGHLPLTPPPPSLPREPPLLWLHLPRQG